MSDSSQKTIADIHWQYDLLGSIEVGIVVINRDFTIEMWNQFMENHKSLDEIDPEILETYEKLGIPLEEQKMLEHEMFEQDILEPNEFERELMIASLLEEYDCQNSENRVRCGKQRESDPSLFKTMANLGKLVREHKMETERLMESFVHDYEEPVEKLV